MGTNLFLQFSGNYFTLNVFLGLLFALDAKLSISTQKIASFYLKKASRKLKCCI